MDVRRPSGAGEEADPEARAFRGAWGSEISISWDGWFGSASSLSRAPGRAVPARPPIGVSSTQVPTYLHTHLKYALAELPTLPSSPKVYFTLVPFSFCSVIPSCRASRPSLSSPSSRSHHVCCPQLRARSPPHDLICICIHSQHGSPVRHRTASAPWQCPDQPSPYRHVTTCGYPPFSHQQLIRCFQLPRLSPDDVSRDHRHDE